MNNKILLLAFLIAAFGITAIGQSVVITAKKTTYTRRKPISDYKKHFVITYPRIKASTPALSRKIEAAISYSSVLGLNLKEELGEYQWLEEADYDVHYNNDGILCLDLFMEGSGAYPSSQIKTVVVNIAKGTRVRVADVFTNLAGLTALVKKAQAKEMADAIKEMKADPENTDSDPESLFRDAKFTAKNLDGFVVTGEGITFKYDYGFPHVIQALQPAGEYFFTWADLKPFISRGSLLTRISR